MKNVMAKGSLWIMFSQVVFLTSGYLIHIFLGRYFGPGLYGTFGIVLSLMVIIQIFLQKGLPQAVSKFMAEHKDKQKGIYKKAIKLQFLSAAFFTIMYFCLAEFLAYLLKDPGLTNYIRFSSLLIMPTAFFALYADGFFNGKRMFKKQSYIRMVHSICKVTFVFIFIFLGLKIYGAIGAYILSALVAFIVGKAYFKIGKSHEGFDQKKIIYFAIPTVITSAAYVLIKNIDLLFIKNILGENILAGYYTSAMTLSNVTYLIFAGLSMTLLPSISQSVAEKDIMSTKSYIEKSLRYVLILLIPSTFLISATSTNLVKLFYSSIFSAAGPALSILIFGSTFLAIFVMLCSIITGSGKPKIAMTFGLVLIPISIVLNYLLIPKFNISGAAIATTTASFIGAIIASVYIIKRFKTFISFYSFTKIMFASLIVYYLAIKYQFSGIMLILTYITMFIIYFGILVVLKEIKKQDITLIKNVIRG